MDRPGARSVLSNAFYLASARTIASLARVIYALLLARVLGAELYGAYNYGLSWYLVFLPLAALGMDAILVRQIGRSRDNAASLIGQSLVLRGISSLSFAVLSVLLGWSLDTDPTARQLLLIFSLALLGRSLSQWCNIMFVAHESSRFVLQLELLFRVLEVVVGIILLSLGFGLLAITIVHAGCWLAQGLFGHRLVRRHLNRVEPSRDARALVSLIRLGIPFVLIAFAGSWLTQGPIIVFRHLEGVGEELGQLALALQAFYILGSIVRQLSGPALPVLSRAVDRGDGKGDLFVSVVLRSGALLIGWLVIAGLALSEWIVVLLLGDAYGRTSQLLPWTLALVPLFFCLTVLSSAITAHGRYWLSLLPHAGATLVFTVAVPFTIVSFQALGAVLSLGSGLVAGVLVQLIILGKYQNIDLYRSLVRPLTCSVVAIFTCWMMLALNKWIALFAGTIALIILVLVVKVFDRQEQKGAVEIINSMFHRR